MNRDSTGFISWYKAKRLAKEFSEISGVDLKEVRLPVAKYATAPRMISLSFFGKE